MRTNHDTMSTRTGWEFTSKHETSCTQKSTTTDIQRVGTLLSGTSTMRVRNQTIYSYQIEENY